MKVWNIDCDYCVGVFSSKEKAIEEFIKFMEKIEPTFALGEIKEVPDYVIINYSWENGKCHGRVWIGEYELDKMEPDE